MTLDTWEKGNSYPRRVLVERGGDPCRPSFRALSAISTAPSIVDRRSQLDPSRTWTWLLYGVDLL